ncbi:MAG TPA: DcrB-related protein [Thermomicrobiales bacterium]|jgi:hypothetical protein
MIRYGWWKILVFVALIGLCSATAVMAQGATFADAQQGFSFTVPSGWQQGSPPPSTSLPAGTVVAAVFNTSAPVNGSFNVVTVAVPAGTDLDQVTTQSRAGVAKSLPGYQEGPGGIQNLTVGGQPARRYDYFLTPPQASKLHGAQILALRANTIYILTFTAPDDQFDAFFQQGSSALNSFTFTGTGGATMTALPSTGMPTRAQWQGTRALLVLMLGSALIAAGFTVRRSSRV